MVEEYILQIEDTYRIEAEDEDKAEEKLLSRIGTDGYEVYNVAVIDRIE